MKAFHWRSSVCALTVLLSACAGGPPIPASLPLDALFHDDAFEPATVVIDPAAALAVTPDMRRYLATHFHGGFASTDRRREFIEALYRPGDLKLEYDAQMTRTASEAFEARSGNCLALVLMTAAFAKELGLRVRYQSMLGEGVWDRADDLYLAIGHVNLSLEDRWRQTGANRIYDAPMVVDFLPPRAAQALSTRDIEERTAVAMYLNNRAVETLAQGRLDDAYWWARAAIGQDPLMQSGYNTLGVIYRLGRHPAWALAALEHVSEHEPANLDAISNRVLALRDLGRLVEADGLARRLAELDPHPPYSYFREGMVARRERRFEDARRLFAKEVDREPGNHEFEFWLAVSYLDLNDAARASLHLTRAMEAATTRKDRALYAAKLDRLKAVVGAP
jgi:Flp pilus assembly protein TadD